jgi:hypothetical protein
MADKFDPFYEQMTPRYKIMQLIEKNWPAVHKTLNRFVEIVWENLRAMIISIKDSLKY